MWVNEYYEMIRKLNEKLIELREKEKDLGCCHSRSNLVLAATVILRVVIVPSLGYKIQPWECIVAVPSFCVMT